MKILFTTILFTQICFAQDVKVVRKGEQVPFDGVLFTRELEKSIRMDIQISQNKIDTLTKLNELNDKEIDILTERLKNHQQKVKDIVDREVQTENSMFFRQTLYFISGALITGLISYGVNR